MQPEPKSNPLSTGKNAIVLAAYFLGTGVHTFPLLLDLSRPFSPPGDYLLITYGLCWQIHALMTQPWNLFQANVMYPTPSSLAVATPLGLSQLILFWPAKLLSGDPIVAINCLYLGNILLTAISTFAVLRHAGLSHMPAFIAGWSFAFSVPKLHQNFQFPFFWLVWTFYAWFQFLYTRKLSWLILASFSFLGMSLGSFYLMYMGFLSLLAATLVFHWRIRPILDRSTIIRTTAAGAMVALMLVPFGLPYFDVHHQHKLGRSVGESIQYSADPLGSYLLPHNESLLYQNVQIGSSFAPLPGEERLFESLLQVMGSDQIEGLTGGRYGTAFSLEEFHSIWAADNQERRLFPGYSVLALVALAALTRQPASTRALRVVLYSLLISSVLLSLGPVIVVLGHLTYTPGPYLALYYLLPGIEGLRATARFGYVALLALSGLAAFGWRVLSSRPSLARPASRYVAVISWLVLFSLEHLPAHSHSHSRPEDPPPVYDFLATRDIPGGVVELPTFKGSMQKSDSVYGDRRIEFRHREYLYMYYSTFHWQPIYNGFGAFVGPHQFGIRDALDNLPDPKAVAHLHSQGLTTLVLHTYWFDEEDKAFWGRPEIVELLEPVATVGRAEVYYLLGGG